VTRRELLALSAGLLAGCSGAPKPSITGSFAGASHDIGHLLRGEPIPEAARERRVPIVIVGGGVAGLSAGWYLQRHGVQDFEILELESEAGGNARFGENRISAYPWGAHYVPLPGKEAVYVRELFEELGVITGYNHGEPTYRDEYLCFDPQERLFLHGRWQEGLIPTLGTTDRDRKEFGRFGDFVRELQSRRAFTIPMEFSSRDRELLMFDSLSMRDFLESKGWHSPALHWYVNYACRDDYGCDYADVSAWAGLHYFASRDTEENTVLTWPEGNGFIIKRLREKLTVHIRPGSLVIRVAETHVDCYDVKERVSSRLRADRIILACPTFLARRLMESPPNVEGFQYAPWLVANLTLDEPPVERSGAPMAWDNVIYDSNSLGYVVATHQSLRTHERESVWTFYYPLTGSSPREERTRLLNTSWEEWVDFILADLSGPHPEIRRLVSNIDIMRWGHAMVRPTPGFIWGKHRAPLTRPFGRIHFAHSDLSGFSIFEEAQYRGVVAAQWALGKSL
jgi:glycine/D-amino acid oxidase-like deaminating enzyme